MARKKQEFKQDARASILKNLYMTRLQRLSLLKWSLYGVVCVILLLIQDVIMSRVSFYGATTDLVPMVILLTTVLVGSDHGSVFALVTSLVYWFSGSAPGPYCIGLLTVLGITASLIRQTYWRMGLRSTVLCAGVALVLYEMTTFFIGLITGLTLWTRAGAFLFTGLVSWAVMVPMYLLLYKIGKIGGEPWRE